MDRFSHRRVRVHRGDDVLCSCFESNGETELVDQFRGILSDDVGSKDFTIRFRGDDLDKPFRLADCDGLAQCTQWERAYGVLDSSFPGCMFGHPDGGDLWRTRSLPVLPDQAD